MAYTYCADAVAIFHLFSVVVANIAWLMGFKNASQSAAATSYPAPVYSYVTLGNVQNKRRTPDSASRGLSLTLASQMRTSMKTIARRWEVNRKRTKTKRGNTAKKDLPWHTESLNEECQEKEKIIAYFAAYRSSIDSYLWLEFKFCSYFLRI